MQTISKSPSLEWQLSNGIVSNRVIRNWEFDVQVVKWLDGQKNKTYDKMLLYPIESGNYVELRKNGKNRVGYIIELKNLLDIKVAEQTSGYIIKRQDLILEITFVDNSSADTVNGKHTVSIDVEDRYAHEIIDLVKKSKDIEQGYWKKSSVIYHTSDDGESTNDIFLEAPFFAENERIKWFWRIVEREDKRSTIAYLRALTNFRVFEYNYKFHTGRARALNNIEDVLVTMRDDNKDIPVNETQFGIFTDINNTIEVDIKNTTKMKAIGDITFIANDEPFATFRSIGNPDDIARIVETEKENILSSETQAQRNSMAYDLKGKDPFDIVPILRTSICALCHKQLGFMRYNPKKEWHIDGQLCGECFGNPTRFGTKQIISEDSRYACHLCKKNFFSLEFESENLCFECFEQKYGKVLLTADRGEYYGGHKVHLAGGTFGDYESGKMFLTEEHFIFARGNKDISKRWEIVIPLSSVLIEQWSVKGESRRKQIAGGGSSLTSNFAFGGGVIHETGQRHRLLIPYVDENGIVQQPIFGVSSYGGKDIRKWAETLYEQLVEEKQQQSSSDIKENFQTNKDSDPIAVLKLRYAKGEITKKEYEEMRKTLVS